MIGRVLRSLRAVREVFVPPPAPPADWGEVVTVTWRQVGPRADDVEPDTITGAACGRLDVAGIGVMAAGAADAVHWQIWDATDTAWAMTTGQDLSAGLALLCPWDERPDPPGGPW